jgi:hypothetical protein
MTHVPRGRKFRWLTLAAAVACLATAAVSFGATSPPRVSCGGTVNKIDIYFWPHGHPAVPSIKFPKFSPAHVEVYKAGSVANAGQLGYLDVKNWGPAKACKETKMGGVKFGTGARTTLAKTAKITCKLPAQAQLVSLPNKGANNLWVMLGQGGTAVLWLTLKPGGSQAIWLSKYCSSKPVPGVK